jgi:hypothetical protein
LRLASGKVRTALALSLASAMQALRAHLHDPIDKARQPCTQLHFASAKIGKALLANNELRKHMFRMRVGMKWAMVFFWFCQSIEKTIKSGFLRVLFFLGPP